MEASLYIVKGTDQCACGEAHGFLRLSSATIYCEQNNLPATAILEAAWAEEVPLSESHERWQLVLLPAHGDSQPLVFFKDSPAAGRYFHTFDLSVRKEMKLYFPRLCDPVHREPTEEERPIFLQ